MVNMIIVRSLHTALFDLLGQVRGGVPLVFLRSGHSQPLS
jgi:hypothetical protein